jgi:2'-5' RNA ligase
VRLFTAITLDDRARSAAVALQERVRRALDGAAIAWVRPEHLHVTLTFMGQVPAERSSQLIEAMADDLIERPFDISLGGIGMFPVRGAPRVIWIGVVSGADRVIGLQRRLVDRLVSIGLASEGRPFHPHVTVGRWRREQATGRRRVDVSATSIVATVRVDEVTTYESRLSPQGPTHTVVARARLREPT